MVLLNLCPSQSFPPLCDEGSDGTGLAVFREGGMKSSTNNHS